MRSMRKKRKEGEEQKIIDEKKIEEGERNRFK